MSEHHKRAGWNYRTAQTHKARNAGKLPALCVQGCGRMVTPDMVYGKDWENGHYTNLAEGGSVALTGPAHVGCNRSDGGKLGAARTNEAKRSRKRQRAW